MAKGSAEGDKNEADGPVVVGGEGVLGLARIAIIPFAPKDEDKA